MQLSDDDLERLPVIDQTSNVDMKPLATTRVDTAIGSSADVAAWNSRGTTDRV